MSDKISKTCEVYVTKESQCGEKTVAGYAASGGGWMALCEEHAKPHRMYCWPVEMIRAGTADRLAAQGLSIA